MKRTGRILSLVLLIVMLASSLTFADALELEDTYPKNGYKNAAIDNFGIKLFFNQDVNSEEFAAENEKCLKLTDPEGKKVPIIVVYSEEEQGMVLVLADVTDKDYKITESTKYTLTISEDFTASNGETLGEDVTIDLTTLNQSRSQKINMALMLVMFGSIMFFSRKQNDKKEEVKEAEEKINPYKVAKETGKSVEEVIEEDRKKKEKLAAKEARKAKKEQRYLGEYDDDDEEEEEVYDSGRKHVKGPRPISAGGSTYITGRKAEAEKARHKGTTNPKRGKAGAKNKK